MNYTFLFIVGAVVVAAVFTYAFVKDVRRAFLVPEGYAGLLYHKGKFVSVLKAGRHIRWSRHYTLDAQDLRKAALLVAGQEVLTADNVSLKLSLLVSYQVVDPAKAAHDTQNWQGDLYNAAQLALRAVVNGAGVEALLNQRLEIGTHLLARVQPEGAKIGVNVLAVEVKDVMFPAELKRAFSDVLKAKQEGQAAPERARGESAALRNLANAARVLEGDPALMNLHLSSESRVRAAVSMAAFTSRPAVGRRVFRGLRGDQARQRHPNACKDASAGVRGTEYGHARWAGLLPRYQSSGRHQAGDREAVLARRILCPS
jgi:regulator of protease activity HflC (stomatin/prohibitin superfamily)